VGVALAIVGSPGASRASAPQRCAVSPLSAPLPAAASRFLVTTADGQAAVRDTSGRLIAAIPRPAWIYAYEGVAAAGDRTFFLAGVDPSHGSWKIDFFRVGLDPAGRPGPVRLLPGGPLVTPGPVISGGWVNFEFAASPDGSRLAFGSGSPFPVGPGTPYGPPDPMAGSGYGAGYTGESVIVQDVATGSRRSWTAWKPSFAIVTQFSWGPSGQLGFVLAVAHAQVSGGTLIAAPGGGDVSAFMVLSTASCGTDLIRDSRLVAYAVGRGRSVAAVLGPDGRLAYVQMPQGGSGGQLTERSAATGAVIRVLLSGYQASLGDPMSLDASGRFLLFPLRAPLPRRLNTEAPYLQAELAYVNLRTGSVTLLHIPVMAQINGAFGAAW
jgi:hypothetical protein